MEEIFFDAVGALRTKKLGNAIQNAAMQYGTPFYVYVPLGARLAFHQLKTGLKQWGSGILAFSVKTNPFFGLLKDIKSWGGYAEVVSYWEYQLALNAGFLPQNIIFNGPMKSKEDLFLIAKNPPFTINIDSIEELDCLEEISSKSELEIRIGIRICPPKQNNIWSRFGIQKETGEINDALARIKKIPSLKLAAVHFHLGTQLDNDEIYIQTIKQARALWDEFQFESTVHLDIGGGFPYQHDKPIEDQSFQPPKFFSTLRRAWGHGKRPSIIIEPGRFIAAPSFMLISSVLALKERVGEPTIVVLDSGTNHNVMAAFFEHEWHFIEVTECQKEFRLCGPLCMEDDILSGPMFRKMPSRGSFVAMANAGAYSLSLSRTFIQPRPHILTFRDNGEYDLLVPREDINTSYALFPKSDKEWDSAERGGESKA